MGYSKKSKIRIYFKNGGCDVIPGKLWDDYNLSEVLAYVIDLKKKKKKK